MRITNRQIRLVRRPVATLDPADLVLTSSTVPPLKPGEFLVQNEIVSIDPAMRGWMSAARSYIAPVDIGQVMRAFAAGKVVDSLSPEFPVGTRLTGLFGLQEYCVCDGFIERQSVRRVPDDIGLDTALGPWGLPGLTAYLGLFEIASASPGDVVVVSAAAGAVGSVAVQLALIAGCDVVGIAGGASKCAWVQSLGAHRVVDYKEADFRQSLKDATPGGIDIYFDNVGGEVLDASLRRLNVGARVALCGGISQYNAQSPAGPAAYLNLLGQRATMRGFIYFDHQDRFDVAERRLAGWYRQGLLQHRQHVFDGLGQVHAAISSLFDGSNRGKSLLALKGGSW